MNSFTRHFDYCNQRDLSKFVPFAINGHDYGWVTKANAVWLANDLPNDFILDASKLTFTPHHHDFASRSAALACATQLLADFYKKQLRHENYPVIHAWGDNPLAEIDRIAVPWFGIHGFGVHVNGYVKKSDGLYMWIGERAVDRLVDPSKFDNIIGGGQPIGLSLEENLRKESWEEAGISADIANTARAAGKISYLLERMQGIRQDTLFIYDLELSASTIPHNTDGEVAQFTLLPVAEVAEIVRTTERFKFNCNLVIIDFLMRHGFFTPDHPEYQELTRHLSLAH